MDRMKAIVHSSRRTGHATAVLALLAFAVGASSADNRLSVFAGVEPIRYLAQAIGGDRVTAHVLVPPGQSPHTFEPTPRQLAALEDARLYFAAGMPFEAAWVERLRGSVTGLEVVHLVAPEGAKGHSHADPHPWTDPLLVVELAARIRDALSAADPGGSAIYASGFWGLRRSLLEAHAEMARLLGPFKNRAFVVYHPAWGAFAERYGLRQLPVEASGKSPGARALAGLITEARSAGACAVFVQPQFSRRAPGRVAEALGVPLVPLDPLAANLPEHLPEVARTLARYLEQPCGHN